MPTNRFLTIVASAIALAGAASLSAHEGVIINTDPGPDGAGGSFAASNVVLISQINLLEFGPSSFGEGADCWGYTSASGREYALMGLNQALAVVEITDPANPVIINTISHPSNLWADVKVINDYAYVTTELAGGQIQIIDLTNVDAGSAPLVGVITDTGITRAHNVIVDNLGQRLYFCGARAGSTQLSAGGLMIFDVADPLNPQFLGAYSQSYVHDAQVYIFTSGPNAGKSIAFCFVEGRGIDIVDITNPASTVRLSRTTYSGISYSHQGWFDPATNLLYQGDELDELDGLTPTTLTRVFDCTNLSNPQLVGTYSTGLPSIDHNIYVKDGFVYEANYRSGMRIFDANTNGINPPEVGFLDTYPGDDAADFNGAWTAYPFFDSGLVIISDINRGLFITDPTYAIQGGVPFEYAFPTPLPDVITPAGLTFSFQINDTLGAVDPASVTFHYADTTLPPAALSRDTGHTFVSAPATALGGGLYEVQFPSGACGDTIEFYFTASTAAGLAVISPFASPIVGAPTSPFTAVYADQIVPLIEDAFETEQGWTGGSPGDTATTGIWERVEPAGTISPSGAQVQPETDNTAAPGTLCFITGQQPSNNTNIGANDVDNGFTTLTSPLIDASGAGVATLQYAIWYSNDANNAIDDAMLVEISNDDGLTWFEVETLTASTAGWETRSFPLTGSPAPTSTMRVRFIASDTGTGSIVEAAVDDFAILVTQCAPGLPSDINGDGVVDTADLGILIGAFGSAGPVGDLNGDGAVDTADLGILIAAFGTSG